MYGTLLNNVVKNKIEQKQNLDSDSYNILNDITVLLMCLPTQRQIHQ